MAPPEQIPLRAGVYFPERELAGLAAEAIRREAARRGDGLTLTAVAAELGKSVSSISDAVNQPDRPMTALRREIVTRYGGYDVEGPFFRLRKPDGDA